MAFRINIKSDPVKTVPRVPFDAKSQRRINHLLRTMVTKDKISERVAHAGSKVQYMSSYDAIQQANSIFGFEGWSDEIKQHFTDVRPQDNSELGIGCIVRVTTRGGSYHEDIGYGFNKNKRYPKLNFEKSSKEAVSDARKRALKTFGQALGNCIYDKKYREHLKFQTDTGSVVKPMAYRLEAAATSSSTSSSSSAATSQPFGAQPFTPAETDQIKSTLACYVPAEATSKRAGPGGSKLTYIESHMAIRIANSIFGFENWSCEIRSINKEYASNRNGRWSVGVSATVRVTLRDGTFHEDIGFDETMDRCLLKASENAYKSAVSDARKRALRLFGDALGNCLYDKEYLIELNEVKTKGKLPTKMLLSNKVIDVTSDTKAYEEYERLREEHENQKQEANKEEPKEADPVVTNTSQQSHDGRSKENQPPPLEFVEFDDDLLVVLNDPTIDASIARKAPEASKAEIVSKPEDYSNLLEGLSQEADVFADPFEPTERESFKRQKVN